MKYSQRIYENPAIWEKPYDPEATYSQYDRCYAGKLPGKDAMIADIGCGRCEWLLWLQKQGYRKLAGLDFSANALGQAKDIAEGVKIHHGRALEFLRARPATFDLLHAKDIAEHMTLDELVEFLDAAHAALRPGGEIWILTFNAQSPFANSIRYGDPTHETGLTPASLSKLFSTCGFAVKQVRGIHFPPLTLKGRLRRALWIGLTPLFQMVLQAAHGNHRSGTVDAMAMEPDIFGIGQVEEAGA
jgi:cyclopropane fatty-acyl-phospholipid synthase-like methyltransferase